MIKTEEVREFFDRLAPGWDDDMVRNEEVITRILDEADVFAGLDILDVACGTGVLIPDYLKRGVSSVTGIDLSSKMAAIAAKKFPQPEVTILCGDAAAYDFGRCFDRIMIYNAFPHFPDPGKMIEALSRFLKPGGRLTAAHGASREKIDAHHHGAARNVSLGLMPAEDLKALFESKGLTVTAVISDERMYQVVGCKA